MRGNLTYTVDGIQVVKTIERLSLTPIDVGGIYIGGMLIKNSAQCNGGANTTPYAYQLIVTEKAALGRRDRAGHARRARPNACMEGVTVQTGRVRTMPNGTYTCGDFETTVAISDMRRTSTAASSSRGSRRSATAASRPGRSARVPQQ